MIILFQYISRGAQSNKVLATSPRCLGMPCFDPTEYTVTSQMIPFGNLFQRKAFNWNLDYWFCRGFWNKEVLHADKDICPANFDLYDSELFHSKIQDNWMFKII